MIQGILWFLAWLLALVGSVELRRLRRRWMPGPYDRLPPSKKPPRRDFDP
jgi:hypothetical protein